MSEIMSKKEAIEMLFQELYESGADIWADTIHECMLFLADDAEAFETVEALNEDYEARDITVIHRKQAYELIKEEMNKALVNIKYKLDNHHSLKDGDYMRGFRGQQLHD